MLNQLANYGKSFFIVAGILLAGCTKTSREPDSIIPPLAPGNTARVPGDETPVVPSTHGFVLAPIPGVPEETPKAPTYTDYYGVQN